MQYYTSPPIVCVRATCFSGISKITQHKAIHYERNKCEKVYGKFNTRI